ncbi:hypothetical protein LP420_11685 [Massilia sp. B-10]|nr:hypothetical protein LP420_11685 [Massilia sp. B-10]
MPTVLQAVDLGDIARPPSTTPAPPIPPPASNCRPTARSTASSTPCACISC